MTKFKTALIAAAVFAFAGSAFAQDGGITLQVNSGSVMTSNGGEFASAGTGSLLTPGSKIMINAGSSASAVFSNGCRVEFSAPGTYTVPSTCAAGASNSGSHAGVGKDIAIFAGVAAVAIGGIASQKTEKPQPAIPVSGGNRTP